MSWFSLKTHSLLCYRSIVPESKNPGVKTMTAKRKSKPVAQEAYNQIAEVYAARIDTKAHNAYYERPATLSLLPEVKGKRVLDVGCGPGVYSEWLVGHGAEVVAFDANSKMVKLAKRRLGSRAHVLRANLEQPLDFLPKASFDLVICPLVLDYVRDWDFVFRQLYQVLKSKGCLVFSIGHPFDDYDKYRQTSNYFNVELVKFTWKGFGKVVDMPFYRRPLSAVINPLLEAGFILDHILEPLPTPEFKDKEPEDYEKLMRSPGFMCIRALKP